MSSLEDLASFTVRWNRASSAFDQPLGESEQVVQMLVGREDGGVQTKVQAENRLLVINPLNVGTRILLGNVGMSLRKTRENWMGVAQVSLLFDAYNTNGVSWHASDDSIYILICEGMV